MPKQSIAEYVGAWEKLIANAKNNAADVPGMADLYMPPMEKILEQAKDLCARLEMRKAVKQEESKERRILMREGKMQAARVRAALKAYFGVNSERLVEFGARPIRPRTRKSKEFMSKPAKAAPPAGDGNADSIPADTGQEE